MSDKPNGKHQTSKILIAVLIGLFILGIGVFAGLRVNHFRKIRGDRLVLRNAGNFGPRGGISGRMMKGKQSGINHQSGEITKITDNSLVIKNSDNKEINLAILDDTSIYTKDGSIASISDLKTGIKINVFGRPNSAGVVQAKIIKIQ